METIGMLLDKLIILSLRKAKSADPKALKVMQTQRQRALDEIDGLFARIASGQEKKKFNILQPKLKNYAADEKRLLDRSDAKLSEAVGKLIEANSTLWGLEDVRRDKNLSDAERLKAADSVSVWNQKRNDAMDEIDQVLWQFSKKIPKAKRSKKR